MFRWLSRVLLKIWGWSIQGAENTIDVPKKLFAVVPHTSNWDFLLGILVRQAADMRTSYLGKKSLFRFPFGTIFRWLGGYPVDRSRHSNQVNAIAALFDENDEFSITIAPEGTRKKVDRLKTGFYFIALKANIPVILTKFDADQKIVSFSKPFWPTGDVEKDMAFISNYFKGVKGINPKKSYYPKEKNTESKKVD